jgi:hypothetical protein
LCWFWDDYRYLEKYRGRPRLGSQSNDGSRADTEIAMNDREITGEFKITILSKPDFRIDPVTGKITVSDSSVSFTGACEKVDTDAAPKF